MTAATGPLVLWVLFGSWVVHDAEELVVGPGWLARHEARLESLAAESPAARRFLDVLERDRGPLAVAIGVIGVFVLVATVLGYLDPRGWGMLVYVTILGGFALHVGVHVAQAVVLRGYVPGLVTGVVVVVPACAYLYVVLLGEGYVSPATAVVTAVVGLAVVVPTAVVAHAVGRRVAAPAR
ncbi:HXXEE domain-containing protein [Halobacteriaceae archaeon GCM10025711]